MGEVVSAEFALDDDCLGHIVASTSCGLTLFALARVSPTLQRLVLASFSSLPTGPSPNPNPNPYLTLTLTLT